MNHFECQSVNTTQVEYATTTTVTTDEYHRQDDVRAKRDTNVGKEYAQQVLTQMK
jgi:hypothetical protein